jgi:hypothetical protein
MPEQDSFGVGEIAHRLQLRLRSRYHTILLLGSRAGALYRSNLHKKLEAVSLSNLNDLPPPKRLEACYHILFSNARLQFSEAELHQLVGTSLQEVEFSIADIGLAELIKLGYFNTVITTNIDDTLERALSMIDVKDLEIIIGHRTKNLNLSRNYTTYQIIKVFGDILSMEYNLKERTKYIHEKSELKKYCADILSKDVLMIGIDPAWDTALVHMIPLQGGTLWYIDEEPPPQESLMGSILHARHAQCISGREGNYEHFIFMLYKHLCSSSPFNYKLGRDILNHMDELKKRIETIENRLDEVKKHMESIIAMQNTLFDAIAKIK